MNIVLHEPEIPQNTGNIGRTCVATGAALHLIEPIGFRLSEKHLRRAGLDYWTELNLTVYKSFEDFISKNPNAKIYMATTKAHQLYTDISYDKDAFIMFGKESAGIPEDILLDYEDTAIRIPMLAQYRSLNLSNSVSVILYEALRQQGFQQLLLEGKLHRNSWQK